MTIRRGYLGPLAERHDHLVVVYVGGPWDGARWTPANPAGVLVVHRCEGWTGAYRRHQLDHAGAWRYVWQPDPTEEDT